MSDKHLNGSDSLPSMPYPVGGSSNFSREGIEEEGVEGEMEVEVQQKKGAEAIRVFLQQQVRYK